MVALQAADKQWVLKEARLYQQPEVQIDSLQAVDPRSEEPRAKRFLNRPRLDFPSSQIQGKFFFYYLGISGKS